MKFRPTMSIADLSATADELAADRLILERNVKPEILADRIVEEAEPGFLAELGRSLQVAFFASRIRAKIRKEAAKWRETLPEEFDRLPLWITGKRGKRVRLDRATHTDAVEYCKFLGRKHIDRKSTDVKFTQAQLFRDSLKDNPGAQAWEALGFDFGK